MGEFLRKMASISVAGSSGMDIMEGKILSAGTMFYRGASLMSFLRSFTSWFLSILSENAFEVDWPSTIPSSESGKWGVLFLASMCFTLTSRAKACVSFE